MAKDRLSMRKFKEVLRLNFEHGLTNRKIAKSCAMSHVTVGKYLTLAENAEITWPLPDDIFARVRVRIGFTEGSKINL